MNQMKSWSIVTSPLLMPFFKFSSEPALPIASVSVNEALPVCFTDFVVLEFTV